VTAEGASHRLFITRTTHTMILDAISGNVLGDVPGQKSAHGVAIVPALNRGFITDGEGSGAIIAFDLKTYAVIGRIPTMPDSDGITYDSATNKVLAVSGDGNALMTFSPDIDPQAGRIDSPINLGGAPEALVADGTGKVYVDLADKDVVAVVDLKSRSVVARWPVAPGGRPTGLGIDRAGHRLFVGCRNPQKLVVMNADTGAVESSMPIGAGVDATEFSQGEVFVSCRDGSLTIASSKAGHFDIEQVVKTPIGARTLGIDETTDHVYLPTADFEPAASSTGRPKAIPGTFVIVMVARP
jgi:DNA-binding beta-propeller fold protein YncE